jgi:hypothetical protein
MLFLRAKPSPNRAGRAPHAQRHALAVGSREQILQYWKVFRPDGGLRGQSALQAACRSDRRMITPVCPADCVPDRLALVASTPSGKPNRSRAPLLNTTGVFDLRNTDCETSRMAPDVTTAGSSSLNRPSNALHAPAPERSGRRRCGAPSCSFTETRCAPAVRRHTTTPERARPRRQP